MPTALRAELRHVLLRVAPAALVALVLVVTIRLSWLAPLSGGDTIRYTQGAQALLNGTALPPEAVSYLGYVAAVAAAQAVGAGQEGVIFLQIALVVLSAVAVFDLGRQLAGRFAGCAAVLLLALETEHAVWHRFILTDSMYLSLVPITLWSVHRAAERHGRVWPLVAFATMAVTALVRPNGWPLAALCLGYWVLRSRRSDLQKAVGCVGIAAVLAGCFSLAPPLNASNESVAPKAMLFDGRVIWGLREVNHVMPPASPDESALAYVLAHPLAAGNLAVSRVATELAVVRPYYSDLHNAKILFTLLPLYGLAGLGAWRHRRRPLARLLSAAVALHLAIVAVTFADYDNRFVMHVIPVLIALAGAGASALVARLREGSREDEPQPVAR